MDMIELGKALGRIEAQGKATHDLVASHVAEDVKVHEDLEDRMRSQEKFKWAACGVILFISSVGGYNLFG